MAEDMGHFKPTFKKMFGNLLPRFGKRPDFSDFFRQPPSFRSKGFGLNVVTSRSRFLVSKLTLTRQMRAQHTRCRHDLTCQKTNTKSVKKTKTMSVKAYKDKRQKTGPSTSKRILHYNYSCIWTSDGDGNIFFYVLVPSTFQKYNACSVYL